MGITAKHSDAVTDEMWNQINKFNREMVDEYLENKVELSEKSQIDVR